jgi:hypothetical protein
MIEDNNVMVYDKSPIPSEKPGGIATERNPDRAISADEGGGIHYASADAEGMVEIVLPAAHGPNSEERLLVKDFGRHVAREVGLSLEPNPYPVSSPRRSATLTFRHYVGTAQGASLMDKGALGRMEALAREFEETDSPKEYFEQVLKPYLHSLSPKRRG